MIINCTGSTKANRALAEKTILWSIKKLGLNRLRSLNIDVKLKNLTDGEFGFCDIQDDNRNFIIEVNKNVSIKNFVSTIIHEMVHVKQYARNEMNGDDMRWKSKIIPKDTDYIDLPWEKEAYRLEAKFIKLIWEENIL